LTYVKRVKKTVSEQKKMKNILAPLSQTSLFSGLPGGQLENLADIAVIKSYRKGTLIFTEGDDADGFYIVIDGQVKIFKASADGKEQILHIFGAGEPFGEVPVFSGQRFPASALSLKKSDLLFFPRRDFIGLIASDTSMALNMLAVLSMRLRRFATQIEDLSLKEVPGRLAGHLIYLSREQGDRTQVSLAISKGQLASLLGTIPETLSRILSKMATQGLIAVNGRDIRLLDSEGLQELAEYGKLPTD
jgi:CRP-like cAMP-binding protein